MAVDAGSKYESVEINTGSHAPIGEDEPVFPLRGRDAMAVATIECYRELCVAGDSPPDHLAAIDAAAEAMRSWQQANPELIKQPD